MRSIAVADGRDQQGDVDLFWAAPPRSVTPLAPVFDELGDDAVDAVDVIAHRRLLVLGQAGQLDLHAQSGQRRTDVVRNAGESDSPIAPSAARSRAMPLNLRVEFLGLGRTVLGQIRGAGVPEPTRPSALARFARGRSITHGAQRQATQHRQYDRQSGQQPPGPSQPAVEALKTKPEPQ